MDLMNKELENNNKSVFNNNKDIDLKTIIDKELKNSNLGQNCVQNYCKNYDKSYKNGKVFYKCKYNLCIYGTHKSSQIVRHIRTHTKEKPFLCHHLDCNRSYAELSQLRVHLIRHFDDKPFKCNQFNCESSFTSKKSLILHIKSHFAKPFVCDFIGCGKGFVTNWLRNKHKKTHKLIDNQLNSNGKEMGRHSAQSNEVLANDQIVSIPVIRFGFDLTLIEEEEEERDDNKRQNICDNRPETNVTFIEEIIDSQVEDKNQPFVEIIEDFSNELGFGLNEIYLNESQSSSQTFRTLESIHQLIETKLIEGSNFYYCKCSNNCHFNTDIIAVIVEHINQHISHESIKCYKSLKYFNFNSSCDDLSAKENVETNGQSLDKYVNFFDKTVVNGKVEFLCKIFYCDFKTNNSTKMFEHLVSHTTN
jgi:hypothetical protein